MTEVFISYAREDTDFVRRIYNDLVKNERNAWIDWEDIPLTADWLQEAYAGIEGSDAFVFIISPASIRSGPCMLELEHALQNNKRLVPLLRREILDPEDVKLMHPSLSAHNWVKVRDDDDYDSAFQSVMTAIDTDLDYLKAHTRYIVRGSEWDSKGRDASLLLRGNDLRDAEAWLALSQTKQPTATQQQTEYILSSRASATQRFRLTLLGVAIVMVMAGLAIFALIQRQVAVENANEAIAARATSDYNADQSDSFALAASAQQLLYRDNNTDLAIALALEANRLDQSPPLARSILAQAAYAPGTRRRLPDYALYPEADMAVSPDSTRILALTDDKMLVLRDFETNATIYTWDYSSVGDDPVRTLAFSPDGTLALATLGGNNGELVILDLTTGEERFRLTQGGYAVTALFLPDNFHILAGYGDGKIRIWNSQTGQPEREFIGLPDVLLYSVAITANQQTVAGGYIDGQILLWDYSTGALLSQKLEGHTAAVRSLAFSADGSQLLSGSEDFTLRLWDLATGQTLYQFVGHKDRVRRVMFAPDGRTAFSASADAHVIQWDLASGQFIRTFVGHSATIYSVVNMPDDRILTASSDGTIRLWDTVNGAQIRKLEGHNDSVYSVAISPDGTKALSGSQDGTVIYWDLTTGERIFKMRGHTEGVRGVAFSPDGTKALSGSRDDTLILWDLSTGTPIRRLVGHDDDVWGVDFSPDGRTALSGSRDATLILWDLETGRQIRRFRGHESRIYNVHISPDGRTALSASSDKSVRLWDLETGTELMELDGHNGAVYDAVFSPDGQYAISCSQDLTMILWDLSTGQIVRQFTGHTADVTSVSFTQDGHQVFSASLDGTLRLWNVDTGAEQLLYAGHNGGVWDVQISPNTPTFISGSEDRTVRVWRIESQDDVAVWTYANRYIEPLTCEQRSLYRLSVRCDSVGFAPSVTPYLTEAPTSTATFEPTATGDTQTPSPEPSLTPSLTPLPGLQLGMPVLGNLQPDNKDLYTFSGVAGQVVAVSVKADVPANTVTDQVVQNQLNLLDLYVVLLGPDGSIIAENDNIVDGELSDALITAVALPVDGQYTIQVNGSSNVEARGGYTLLVESSILPTATPTPTETPTITPTLTPSMTMTPTPTSAVPTVATG